MNFCDIFEEVRNHPEWWNYYGLDLGKIKADIGTINYADFISKFIKYLESQIIFCMMQ